MVRSTVLATALLAVLVNASPALAQGGAPAPDFDEPCPALYPGDSAPKERLARWMARAAAERGLPHELPVMAAIAESGLRNLRGDSYHGFFGMHQSLNSGDYRGFPRRPELQVKWFIDTASSVRQRRRGADWSSIRPPTRAASGSGSPTSSGPLPRTARATSPTSRRPAGSSRASARHPCTTTSRRHP